MAAPRSCSPYDTPNAGGAPMSRPWQAEEGADGREKGVRLFERRAMAAARQYDESGPFYPLGQLACKIERRRSVEVTAQHQGRGGDHRPRRAQIDLPQPPPGGDETPRAQAPHPPPPPP